jgi:hypothetical protein
MPILTLDVGGAALAVACQKGGHAPPRKAGNRGYAFSGGETSGVRAELMVVPVVLVDLPSATCASIRTLFANGAQVPCSGDVFNNGGTTIICSGTITDEFLQGGTQWFTIALTLYEVGALGYAATDILLYLTNVVGGGGDYIGSTDAADDVFASGLGSVTLMNAPEVIPTCGGAPDPTIACTVGFSAAAEEVWESYPAPADGWIFGTPTVVFLSIGSTADNWSTQAYRAEIYIERAGVDVVQWDTGYSDTNGGFAGGNSTATMANPVVFEVEAGDIMRVEVWSRAGLHSGYADNGAYQVLTFGNGGGNAHYAYVRYRGDALFQ